MDDPRNVVMEAENAAGNPDHWFGISFEEIEKFDFVGNRINASGRYKLGSHTIKYVVEDKCGNKVAKERKFTIINCKQKRSPSRSVLANAKPFNTATPKWLDITDTMV